MHKKYLLMALCFLCLSGCGKGNSVKPPDAYTIGADSAPVLDTLLGEGGSLVSIDMLGADGTSLKESQEPEASKTSEEPEASKTPEEPDMPKTSEAPKDSKDTKDKIPPEEVSQYIYTYAEIPTAGVTVASYSDTLTEAEHAFLIVDENNQPTKAPDYEMQTGTVHLAKTSTEEGHLFRIRLDWTQTSCAVTVKQVEGKLPVPNVEQEQMTLTEAVSFMKGQSPATLGLEGSSMKDYDIYPIEGIVLVDNQPCIQFRVYQKTEKGTNEVAGIYLVPSDKSNIYRVSGGSREVQAPKITQ